MFVGFSLFSQTRSAKYVTVANSNSKFSPAGLAEGTIVTNLTTAQTYVLTAYATAVDNLSTASKVLLGTTTGNNLIDYTGQTILRTWDVGQVISGTVENEFEWQFYTPPTISCNIVGGILFEIGTSNPIVIGGSTTYTVGDVLSSGEVGTNGVENPLLPVFGTADTYLYNITYAPIQIPINDWTDHSYAFQATQDYVGIESGTAISPTRTINAIYPYRKGAIVTDLSIIGDPYTALSGIIQSERSSTSVDYTGDGVYIYFAQLATYDTLTSILDPNGFEIFPDYDRIAVNINSSGLPNDYSGIGYNLYKSKTLKYGLTNYTITFKQ